MYREFRRLAHQLISPFGSSSWSYTQLCAPHRQIGFKQPLRDPWVTNMYLILKDIDFSVYNTEADLPWNLDGSYRLGGFKMSRRWDSPSFLDQSNLTLMEFLGPDFLNWDGITSLPTMDKLVIKDCLINRLIISYSESRFKQYTTELGSDHTRHLEKKFNRYGHSDPSSTLSHFSSLPSSIPVFLVSFFIKLVCNCTNTDGDRRRKFDPDGSSHPLKSPLNPTPCFLCNLGSASCAGDSIKHLFSHCQVVKEALLLLISHSDSPPSHPFFLSLLLQTSPLFILDSLPHLTPDSIHPLLFVLCFCWSVFSCRKQIKSGRDSAGADSRISSLSLSFRNLWSPSPKTPSRYGSSSSKTSTQKECALVDSAAYLDSLPPPPLLIFLGTSSSGNPDPVGAGAFVVYTHPDKTRLSFHLFHPVGHSTQHVGTLWSMGMALTFLSENQTLKNKIHFCSSFFLTDNQWLVGALLKGLPAKHKLLPLLSDIRSLLNNVALFKKPQIKWVPGHVPGASSATSLAKRGSKTILDSVPNIYPDPLVSNLRFSFSVLRDGLVTLC